MARVHQVAITLCFFALGSVGCAGDLGSSTSNDEAARSCKHGNSPKCVDGGTSLPDMASAPAPDLATAPADLATAPKPDLATAAADLAQPSSSPDLAVACSPAVSTTDSGHHNAGLDCGGCHNGAGAIQWYVSGTLYDTVTGTNPIAGASINVTDAAGKKLSLVTALNGNFYTSTPVSYPIRVEASRCPSTTAMSGSVQAPASCNGCHGSTFRIHLP